MKIAVKKLRENAVLPTFGSPEAAGADLYACLASPVTVAPGETAFIPTGLAMELPVGYVGLVYARSGLACKRGLAPANKVGVIDSDYYYSDNEGHIFAKITNDNHTGKTLTVEAGSGFLQAIFIPYGVTYSDDATGVRNGGMGSTDSKS